MSSFTNFLNLFKWNSQTDSEEEFNIDKALNENWDKIDTKLETYMTDLTNEVNQFTEDTNTTINNYKTSTDNRVDELETQISSIKEISISPTEPTADEVLWVKRGKNLFDKDNATILNKYLDKNTGEILDTSAARMFIIKCKSLTTYTISKIASKRFRVGTTSIYPATGTIVDNFIVDETATSITITTDINAKYLCVFYTDTTQDTLSEEEIRNSIQVEYGTEATEHEEHIDTTLNIKENGSFGEIFNIDELSTKDVPYTKNDANSLNYFNFYATENEVQINGDVRYAFSSGTQLKAFTIDSKYLPIINNGQTMLRYPVTTDKVGITGYANINASGEVIINILGTATAAILNIRYRYK